MAFDDVMGTTPRDIFLLGVFGPLSRGQNGECHSRFTIRKADVSVPVSLQVRPCECSISREASFRGQHWERQTQTEREREDKEADLKETAAQHR